MGCRVDLRIETWWLRNSPFIQTGWLETAIIDMPCRKQFEDILNQCAVYNLRRLSRLTTNNLNHALLPTGLRCTQYAIMLAAGARPGSTMTTLADYLGMDISTLTRSTENLEHLGYFHFEYGNHREKYVYLTDIGTQKVSASLSIWEEEQKRFIEAFGKEAWESYLQAMEKYNASEKEEE